MHFHSRLAAPALSLFLLAGAATQASAVVEGAPSSLGHHTVRVVGPYFCSGVAIGRNLVATAAHCANRNMRVQGVGIASVSKSAVLDDGRRVSVTGDAAILRLASALPAGVSPVSIGGGPGGEGERYTIAGYGTADERNRMAFGTLREASLVPASSLALVDPSRTGSIGASACFGDSGGPVLRGSMLVGIITRAAHPSPRIACGHLTRWTPIVVTGALADPGDPAAVAAGKIVEQPRRVARSKGAKGTQVSAQGSSDFFAVLFGTKSGVKQARN